MKWGFWLWNRVLVLTQRNSLFLALLEAILRFFSKSAWQQAAQPSSAAIWVQHHNRHPDQDSCCPVFTLRSCYFFLPTHPDVPLLPGPQ